MTGRAVLRPMPDLHDGGYLLPAVPAACAWLRAQGLRPGQRLALRLTDPEATATLLQAIPRCGASVVLPHARWSPSRLLTHCTALDVSALVAEPDPDLAALPLWTPPPWDTGATHPLPAAPDPASEAAVLFTSGSTGEPRAVPLAHGVLRASARRSAGAIGLDRERCWLACLPLDHIGGAMTVWRSGSSGCPLLVHGGFDTAAVLEDLARCWGLSLVPTMLHRLLQRSGDPWPRGLGCLLIGGGPVSLTDFAAARARGLAPRCTYALTEAGGTVAIQDPDEERPRCGRALPGIVLRLTRDDGRCSCRAGEAGAITLRPDSNWIATGDTGWCDDRGRLHLLDRRTDRILCGGENLSPLAIAGRLTAHPAITAAEVLAWPDAQWGQVPAAVLVATEAVPDDAFRGWVAEHLPGLWRPHRWCWCRSLPLDGRGKPDRPALHARLAAPDSASLQGP